MIQGQAKFDGLAVLEGTFSFMGPTVHLEGKAAFVNSKTGDTHGWTTGKQWSPDVISKLAELRALMEVDLGHQHLVDGGNRIEARAVGIHLGSGTAGGGLGEHIDEQV